MLGIWLLTFGCNCAISRQIQAHARNMAAYVWLQLCSKNGTHKTFMAALIPHLGSSNYLPNAGNSKRDPSATVYFGKGQTLYNFKPAEQRDCFWYLKILLDFSYGSSPCAFAGIPFSVRS